MSGAAIYALSNEHGDGIYLPLYLSNMLFKLCCIGKHCFEQSGIFCELLFVNDQKAECLCICFPYLLLRQVRRGAFFCFYP